jgi:hypothetical protein
MKSKDWRKSWNEKLLKINQERKNIEGNEMK